MVAFGWQTVAQVWAAVLVVMAVAFWLTTEDDPEIKQRKGNKERARGAFLQLEPLKYSQVWRFAIYYFFVFGAFVALALWLPRYLVGVYELDIKSAGMLAAFYSIPASIFRAYGGLLSDKYGARTIMYWTFGVSALCCFLLSYPNTEYVIQGIAGPIKFGFGMGLVPFIALVFILGFFMSLGKAAVYKHIPVYYPDHVGSVGGLVGMIGGLGGFVLPIAFGVMNDLTGVWTSCFMLLFLLVTLAVIWMHFAIAHMEKRAAGETLAGLPELPELAHVHGPEHEGALSSSDARRDRSASQTSSQQRVNPAH
jgi:NNP family nitrate/nitrite transporter-like MFS transporter